MTYKDGGGILLVTDGPLTQEEYDRLLKYVTDVLSTNLKRNCEHTTIMHNLKTGEHRCEACLERIEGRTCGICGLV